MDYLRYILGKILRNPFKALRSLRKWIFESRMDRRLGVSTQRRDFTSLPSVGGDSHPCQPVPYDSLARIALHIRQKGLPLHCFIDVGCGSGRPLAYLAHLGFERMIGLELNAEVAEEARANLRRLRAQWNRAGSMEVRTGDVLASDTSYLGAIVLLANPFGPATLRAFLERLQAQLLTHPEGEIHLIYAYPEFGEVVVAAFPRAPRWVLKGIEDSHVWILNATAFSAPGPSLNSPDSTRDNLEGKEKKSPSERIFST